MRVKDLRKLDAEDIVSFTHITEIEKIGACISINTANGYLVILSGEDLEKIQLATASNKVD